MFGVLHIECIHCIFVFMGNTKKSTSLRLDIDLFNQIKKYSQQNHISMSQAIVDLVILGFKNIDNAYVDDKGSNTKDEFIEFLKEQVRQKDRQIEALSILTHREQEKQPLQIESSETKKGFWSRFFG